MIAIENNEATATFGHGSVWIETWDDQNDVPCFLCFMNVEPGPGGSMHETGRQISEAQRNSKPRINFCFKSVESLDNVLKSFATLRELLVKHEAKAGEVV